MMKASAWYVNNDMIVQLAGFQSSTNTSTYINSSTGVTCHVWKSVSTSSTSNRLTTGAKAMSYVAASNGNYRAVFQTTGTVGAAITSTMRGMAIITAVHSGINGEWRVDFRGEPRGAT